MSQLKIAAKILEVMRQIPGEQEFGKLNEVLLEQKLITRTEYEYFDSKEQTSAQGVVWQRFTVSCNLTIIDTESDEVIVNTAFGLGLSTVDKAVTNAQMMARRYAWMAALNISNEVIPDTVIVPPEIVVETPESKLIDQIKALWKWGDAELESYFVKKRGKGLSELNIPELTVERNDLESYIRGNT